jgi:hypothetical protein
MGTIIIIYITYIYMNKIRVPFGEGTLGGTGGRLGGGLGEGL